MGKPGDVLLFVKDKEAWGEEEGMDRDPDDCDGRFEMTKRELRQRLQEPLLRKKDYWIGAVVVLGYDQDAVNDKVRVGVKQVRSSFEAARATVAPPRRELDQYTHAAFTGFFRHLDPMDTRARARTRCSP